MTDNRTTTAPSARLGLAALTWAHFLNDGYINYLPAVLPLLLVKFHIEIALVGSLIFALQGIGSLLQPVFGLKADRVGGHAGLYCGDSP